MVQLQNFHWRSIILIVQQIHLTHCYCLELWINDIFITFLPITSPLIIQIAPHFLYLCKNL